MATHTTHVRDEQRAPRGGGEAEVGGMDALSLLEMQHREIERVFDRIHESEDEEEIRQALFEVADLVSAHGMIEERCFYPAARSADTDALVGEFLRDHDDVNRALVELLELEPARTDFSSLLEELEGLVGGHIDEEERELFPRVQRMMSDEQLRALGEQLTSLLAQIQQAGPPHLQLMQRLEHRSDQPES